MGMKPFIAWVIGLVFQFAVLVPDAAGVPGCAPAQDTCDCCASPESCPCAESGEPEPSSPPYAPDSGGAVKIPPSRPCDTRISPVSKKEASAPCVAAVDFHSEPAAGFPGVKLTVAYCSLLI
jgi:hypothetical protein